MKHFQNKELYILHLNINSLLPKIDEILFIAKQPNTSITGFNEFQTKLIILNCELDIDNYDLILMDHSWKGDKVAFYFRKPVSDNYKPCF